MAESTETFGRHIRTIKHNQLFLVDDLRGNIPRGNTSGFGLYHMDTRFLSCLETTLNGTQLAPLLSSTEMGHLSTIVFTNGPLKAEADSGEMVDVPHEMLELKRETVLFDHLYDRFSLANYSPATLKIQWTLAVAADFRDMFEIRGIVPPPAEEQDHRPTIDGSEILFSHRDRSDRLLQTRIRIKGGDPRIGECDGITQIRFEWLMPPRKVHSCELQVIPAVVEADAVDQPPANASFTQSLKTSGFEEASVRLNHRAREWHDHTTRFISDNDDFNEMMARNGKDIHMLTTQTPMGRYPVAGIPWFVALFGRDSLITALYCLPLNPDISRDVLSILAQYQGKENNSERDEEPGKILHELRVGELARVGAIPHTPYYGSVDATSLWIILLYEYYRWTDDRETLERLWPHALAAMEWCEQNISKSPNGYCFYAHRPERGILQQGWKDSDDGVVDEDGKTGRPPIALCEVQGYVYQARQNLAHLAEVMGDESRKQRLLQENQEFRRRFNRDFWMADQEFCALALDGQGRPFRVISSNPGHCLYSGILSDEHAHKVARRLLAPDMFSDWGIRTLSREMAAYNPMSYHNGSVWPHDNAMIARGFARMGQAALVEQVFSGLFHASRHMFYKRLPELFCGFGRSEGREADPPVRYPVACIPQAWAAASMYSLVQSMLNFTPNAAQNTLSIRSPKLPSWLDVLHVNNLRVGQAQVDLEFRRSRRTVTVDVKEISGDLNIQVEIANHRHFDHA